MDKNVFLKDRLCFAVFLILTISALFIGTTVYNRSKASQAEPREVYISVLGDSVSDYYSTGDATGIMNSCDFTPHRYPDFDVDQASDMWYNWMVTLRNSLTDEYEYKILTVNALNGSMVCPTAEGNPDLNRGSDYCMYADSRIDGLASEVDGQRITPDIIIVEGGLNDAQVFGEEVLDVDGSHTYMSASVFEKGYSHLIDKLEAAYPEAYIICIAPNQTNERDVDPVSDAIVNVVESYAGGQNICVCDLRESFNDENIASYLADDGIHPNQAAQQGIGYIVSGALYNGYERDIL